MFPFVYAPTYEYPLSGDVTQGIAPVFGDIEGIPEVEHEVITTVASYGKQLGKLTEAVLMLAKKADLLDTPEIVALQQIAEGVAEAKVRAYDTVQAQADKLQTRAAQLKPWGGVYPAMGSG